MAVTFLIEGAEDGDLKPRRAEPGSARQARGAGVDKDARGRAGASDLAPVWIRLR